MKDRGVSDTYRLKVVRARDAQEYMNSMDHKGWKVISIFPDGDTPFLVITFRRKKK